MVDLVALWLPILVSAVVVFFASFVMHMLLPYHRSDFAKLPAEDGVREALRPFDIPPGDYIVPHAAGPEAMRSPEHAEKMRQGPVALLTVLKPGPPAMGKSLVQWFVYSVVVGIFAAYVAGQTLGAGTGYSEVFQIAGCTAFTGYALARVQDSIWLGRKWSTTMKDVFDGLVYGLLTGGIFGWLWPSA